MPAPGTIKLADANVWLAIAFSDHAHHAAAKNWFDQQDNHACVFCRITQMALLRHLTNAKIMGPFVQSQREAWSIYDKLLADARVTLLSEPPTLEAAFRGLSQAESPSHALWTDAYLAALAIETQSQLVTFDQGFSRFTSLDLLTLP